MPAGATFLTKAIAPILAEHILTLGRSEGLVFGRSAMQSFGSDRPNQRALPRR